MDVIEVVMPLNVTERCTIGGPTFQVQVVIGLFNCTLPDLYMETFPAVNIAGMFFVTNKMIVVRSAVGLKF